ncbi:3-mercaptopyruvate sulfurtransferase [Pedomonas sp. V897]|uniref:3-mercaptopyruvate sulfurtransferase n=1 Tax=Pedomonas sp. V897 TaxID=3446482 RepID=UPI003EE1F3DD
MDALVSTEWLAGELGANDLRIVDASWHMPAENRNARAEFEAAHIPGAVFFDIDEIADTSSPLPHMLPSPEKFASRAQALGLGDGSRIVVYDNSDLRSSARAWWMLRVFGAHRVAILDGGFQKWQAEGRPVESGKPVVRHRHFTPWEDRSAVRTLEQMKANLTTKAEQVLDARSASRFAGAEPEPRPGLRAGHIPGARNLPYRQLLAEDGTFKRGEDLRAAFEQAGIDLSRPVVTTCGSGITAAVLAFGLHLLGHDKVALYDGSWTEWGSQPDTPVVTGA